MKSIYKYIIGILVVIGVAVPFMVKNSVDKVIESEKQNMLENGVELSISNEGGFITSTRDYELKITNGKEFRDYLLIKFIQNNPNYKGISELVKHSSEEDIRPVLDGMTFSGTIKTSNLLLTAPVVELSLVKFSDEIMSGMAESKEFYDAAKLMLDEKMITFYITLDSNQKVSKIVMKDIDKKLDNQGETINFKLQDHSLELDIDKDLAGVYKLGKQSIKTDDFLFEMNGVKYKFDYLNQLNSIVSLHVDSVEFKEDNSLTKIGNIDIKGSTKIVKDKTISVVSDYSLEDIKINAEDELKLDEFRFAIDISDLDKDGIIGASKAYNTLSFDTQNATEEDVQVLTDSLQKILNRGLKLDIKSSFSKLVSDKTNLGDMDFVLDAKIKPNTYSFNIPEILNALFVKGSFVLSQKGINRVLQTNGDLEEFTKLGKKKGKKVVFDYELKDGKLFINDKQVF